jgi:Nucleotide modification associated domain 3
MRPSNEIQVVLLRVGIDTGSGGIHAPLFADGSFEYIPIPDGFKSKGLDTRTYGNTLGRKRRMLVDYFPESHREKVFNQSIHFDPEFESFTYGDPTSPKARLRELREGSLLVFYAGLEGWDFNCSPALYIIGFFEVARAGKASSFPKEEVDELFRNNFHVMHKEVFDDQKERLVLVKGGPNSRLLTKAEKISSLGRDKNGHPLHRLSPEMQKVFGDFGGKTSIQRCPPRRVGTDFIDSAARFVKSLR